jgi:hypothetical protein
MDLSVEFDSSHHPYFALCSISWKKSPIHIFPVFDQSGKVVIESGEVKKWDRVLLA